jgi:threonine dehydratase
MEWQVPTLADVLEARRRIAPHLRPTPLYGYASLDELLGAKVFVKHENHQPVGAFKVRGGVNLVSQLSPEERTQGVIAASTGNHGQSIAFAARLFGVQATICVPEDANPVKVASMRGLGAELVFHGRDLDEARKHSSSSRASTATGTCTATRSPFELSQTILWRLLDDFVLVSDDEIRAAQTLLIETTRNLVEAAGAALWPPRFDCAIS